MCCGVAQKYAVTDMEAYSLLQEVRLMQPLVQSWACPLWLRPAWATWCQMSQASASQTGLRSAPQPPKTCSL